MRKGDVILFKEPPVITHWAAVGGKKESEGPLAKEFDLLFEENDLGEESWEKAEQQFQHHCMELMLQKAELSGDELDLMLGGDLQNQCTATSYAARSIDAPFLGLYNACATMAEGVAVGSCLAAGGFVKRAAVITSSHFCAAERQFRTPLNYGGKRTPTAQWTATASGCCLVQTQGSGVRVGAACFGRIRDFDVTDVNNMGAAMAPAAAETLLRYFSASGKKPEEFDAIYTGDLGLVGSRLLQELTEKEGLVLSNHRDCGLELYDVSGQDAGVGASGAGCSASVLCAHILPKLKRGELKRVLFLSTGALMSQTSALQGESIPGVAHLVELLGEGVTE